MLGSLISPIASLAGTWLQGRVDKAKAETDVKVARAKAEAKVVKKHINKMKAHAKKR